MVNRTSKLPPEKVLRIWAREWFEHGQEIRRTRTRRRAWCRLGEASRPASLRTNRPNAATGWATWPCAPGGSRATTSRTPCCARSAATATCAWRGWSVTSPIRRTGGQADRRTAGIRHIGESLAERAGVLRGGLPVGPDLSVRREVDHPGWPSVLAASRGSAGKPAAELIHLTS